jgi:hypothetical protein
MLSEWREVIVCISGIVNHHCLNFLFISIPGVVIMISFSFWFIHGSVYTGFLFIQGLVYTGFCFIQGLVYTGFWFIQGSVYTGFLFIQGLVYT